MSEREREVGLAGVLAAARLCQAVRTRVLDQAGPDRLDKQDQSPVTVADFGSQALICHMLHGAFPADPILAEEDSELLRRPEHADRRVQVAELVGSELSVRSVDEVCSWIDLGRPDHLGRGRYWVLDPIDGTKGFLRGDQYAIALGMIEDGAVTRGFLACPALRGEHGVGVALAAERGGGTQAYTLAGAALGPVRVSQVSRPAEARLAESFEAAHTDHDLSTQVKRVLGITAEPLRMDSQAKYAALADGRAEIYLRAPNPRTPDYRENVWDHAAGWLVVHEAGGRLTDVYGRPFDWSHGRRLEANVGVLATNGPLHDAVLEALAPLLPSIRKPARGAGRRRTRHR